MVFETECDAVVYLKSDELLYGLFVDGDLEVSCSGDGENEAGFAALNKGGRVVGLADGVYVVMTYMEDEFPAVADFFEFVVFDAEIGISVGIDVVDVGDELCVCLLWA